MNKEKNNYLIVKAPFIKTALLHYGNNEVNSLVRDKKILEVKHKISIFLLLIFIITFFISLSTFNGTKKDLIIAKGDVAQREIDALRLNPFNLDPKVDTEELDKIVLKRRICIGIMIASVIGSIICIIIISSPSSDKTIVIENKYEPVNPNPAVKISTEDKLTELKGLLDRGFITTEEYDDKRKDIISKL